MDLTNKIVLITGGSSGIGLALAHQFAERNAHIVLFARSQDQLQAAVDELQAYKPGKYAFIPTDVSKIEQVNQSVQKVIQEAGVPDIIINSAGVAHPGYVQDLDPDVFRWMMDVNYFGAVYVTKAVLPGMIERQSGTIVNIASFSAFVGLFGYSAYGASKFALRGFSDALRMELKPHGIDVSIVYPGDTDTPQLAYENQYKPEELEQIVKMVPATDPIQPDKVARAIIRGIENRQAVIFPDMGTMLFFKLVNLLGRGVYPLLDWLLVQAKQRINNREQQR